MIENKEEKIETLTLKLEEAKADVADLAQQIKEAKDAQAAVANAIAVLEQFYKESGQVKKEEWEFLQRVADPKDQPGGIITILEKTAEEFAQMEADTRAQE